MSGLLVAVIATAGVGVLLIPRQGTAEPKLDGTLLNGRPAPNVRLLDQFGHTVTLTRLRGRPVVLTFMWTRCRETCGSVAETLRRTTRELGLSGRYVAILMVSTDPEGDTVAAVRRFSRDHGMLHRWRYLIGSRQQLRPIWRAYYVYAPPKSAPPVLQEQRTNATYLIDRQGRERVLFVGSVSSSALTRDLRILSGLHVLPSGNDAIPAPDVGHIAPDFVLPTVSGSHLALRSLRGRVVLLNFWTTWCPACRREMPELARWYRELRRQGLVVLGVDKQESRDSVEAFLHKLEIPYPVVLDETGDVSARYDVLGVPTTFLIDGQGIVRSTKVGALDLNYLNADVRPLLSGGG